MHTALVQSLVAAVGPDHVLTDPGRTAGYETDWTGRFSGSAAAVVRPADTAQVAAVLRSCAAHATPVVPQGGNTGLVGGGVPRGGEVLLSLRRLDEVGPVRADVPSITVGAGATLAAVAAVVRPHGLAVGIDLAARDAATIGGMVATDAGGIHVVAHGSMRQQVLGLEAVLADGTVVRRLPGMGKDGTGYDLPQLFAGSEGTLAIITAIDLRLVTHQAAGVVLLIGCPDLPDAIALVATARGLGLRAAELMRASGIALVQEETGIALPLVTDTPYVVLLELTAEHGDAAVLDLVGPRPATIAADAADARRLWHHREAHTESIGRRGVAVKLDVALPLAALTRFVEALDRLVPDAIVFGHLAEGNLHISLFEGTAAQEEAVLRLTAEHGGSIASEHGVGVAKAGHLSLTRSPADIAAMRAIKSALDPQLLLNPGVILPLRGSGGS